MSRAILPSVATVAARLVATLARRSRLVCHATSGAASSVPPRARRQCAGRSAPEHRQVSNGAAELDDAHLVAREQEPRAVSQQRVEPTCHLESEGRGRRLLEKRPSNHRCRGVQFGEIRERCDETSQDC